MKARFIAGGIHTTNSPMVRVLIRIRRSQIWREIWRSLAFFFQAGTGWAIILPMLSVLLRGRLMQIAINLRHFLRHVRFHLTTVQSACSGVSFIRLECAQYVDHGCGHWQNRSLAMALLLARRGAWLLLVKALCSSCRRCRERVSMTGWVRRPVGQPARRSSGSLGPG